MSIFGSRAFFIFSIFILSLLINPCKSAEIKASKFSDKILNQYKEMPVDKLLISGDSFRKAEDYNAALLCYSMVYNSQLDPNDTVLMQILCKALNATGVLYFQHYDYAGSLPFFLRALDIALLIKYEEYIAKIYNNIGGIYYEFKDSKTAKKYYELSFENAKDQYIKSAVLTNLGLISHENGNFAFALSTYKKADSIIKKGGIDTLLYNESLNNIGDAYRSLKVYDSARLFYLMALINADQLKEEKEKALILSNLGHLYFEKQHYDSASIYLKSSMLIAEKYNLLHVISINYLAFSKIEETKGNIMPAFLYYKKYSRIADSLYTNSQYANVNNLLFSYDMNKINKVVEDLQMEQKIKERTIFMQWLIQLTLGLFLLVLIVFLIIIYRKNKTLDQAYSILVKKNKEIAESDKLNYRHKLKYEEMLIEKEALINRLHENLTKSDLSDDKEASNDSKKTPISDEMRRALEMKILEVMHNRDLFCDKNFSLTKLSEITGSNPSYISMIINGSFDKNFNTFVNEYRIKESCRLFADPDFEKYSIETISSMVGFRHKSSFNPVFKEFTGVTPSFYIRSLKNP